MDKKPTDETPEYAYAGFWIRVLAFIIDSILVLFITFPVLLAIYGSDYFMSTSFLKGPWDFIISYVLPAVAITVFWLYKSATPGKMMTKTKIIDAETGGKPSAKTCIIRYLAYYVSSIPLFLGMIWVGFDKRKQGWHDKLAGTLVIKALK